MKLSKRMVPITLVLLLFSVFLSSLVFYSFRQIQGTTQKLITSRQIAENSFNLSYLTNDYLINPTERIKFQWDLAYVKLKRQVNQLRQGRLEPYPGKLLEKISDGIESARHYFHLIVSLTESQDESSLAGLSRRELGREVSADLHQTISSVFALESVLREDFLITQRRVGVWFLAVIAVFLIVFFGFVYRIFKEINQRTKSQEELRKVNQRLRLVDRLVEFTGEGVYRYSYDEGKILYANQGFIEIMELSCSPEQVVGKRLEDVFSYVEKPGTIRSLTEEKGSLRNHPYRFKTLAGKDKWVLHNSFLVEDKKSKKVLEAIITDITEKRKIEQRNKFLAGMLDNAPLSVIATDQDRKIIYVNPATEDLFGYSFDELIGKDPLIVNAEPNRQEIENEIIETVKKGKTYTKRLLNKKNNDQVFTAEASIYQLKDKEGNFVALVGFQKDVTQEIKTQEEIKESEIKFRTIFKKAGSAIFIADPKTGKVLDCNQRAEELMGMQRQELIGITQDKLHPPQEVEKYKKEFFKHAQKGIGNYQGEVVDKQGKRKPVWISAEFFSFKKKNLLVGFFIDLSQRFELEKKEKETLKASVRAETEHAKAKELEKAYNELKSMQDKLVEAEKLAALGKLSGIVAHDLRNPLAVIRNSVYILKKSLSGVKDPKIVKYLELLDEEIDIADSIIEEVLSFTRVKGIKASLFDINDLAERVLNKLNIPGSIEVKKNLAKNIPQMKGDREQLQRLLTNLLRNAIEAMEGGGKLTVKTLLKEKTVLIEISDTGIGINQEDVDKIFEPMYSTKIQGTGLGLPACRNIVEAHKGYIYLESLKGKGTTVSVILPLLPDKNKLK